MNNHHIAGKAKLIFDEHVESDARIISLKQAFGLDNSIAQLADMPLGCCAIRENKDKSWKGFRQ